MHLLQSEQHTRRAFLQRSGQLALTGTALPLALNLAAIGEAAAFDATDYKALVCVFLYGGNDYANTVVTYDDPSYNRYSTIRGGGAGQTAGGIALAKAGLTATLLSPTLAPLDALGQSRAYALHPSMGGVAGLFNTGKAAVQMNVGPLATPLTLAQYKSGNRVLYPVPKQLFSHNDQQSVWQAQAAEGAKVGWGGRMGDLALSSNSQSLFTCMSVTGNAVFLSGNSALQYQVSTNGAIKINPATASSVYGSSAVRQAINSLIRQPRAQALENEYTRVTARSLDSEAAVSAAIAGAAPERAGAPFATDSLSQQLKMVARLIQGRSALGAKRQVFMVSLGGFDLHDNLISQQSVLMDRVSQALTTFYNATVDMGVANQVTAFTASDFGRTLTSNGDGSDHGWGSHHLIVGGAVNGKAFYGTPPPVSVGTTAAPEDQWHVGQGRLLPSTSVDQYAATLAKWFGVNDGELATILPNLSRFGGSGYPVNLGFMS
jgi:uncharacterized protein (DUF1501 family)